MNDNVKTDYLKSSLKEAFNVEQSSPGERTLIEQAKSLDTLEARVSLLRDKLNKVMVNAPSPAQALNDEIKKSQMLSPLFATVRDHTYRIESVIDRLSYIIDTLDV